jgi:hypothetical protein
MFNEVLLNAAIPASMHIASMILRSFANTHGMKPQKMHDACSDYLTIHQNPVQPEAAIHYRHGFERCQINPIRIPPI